MKIYSRKNISDELIDIFDVYLNLPVIKGSDKPNHWISDEIHPAKGFDIRFNTQLVYRSDNTWRYLELTLLGFGFTIHKQTGY